MRAADETGRGEVGNDATESTAAATNAAPIPASAYARLADILIGNPHAQAALGISRGDSDDEVVEIHHPATMMSCKRKRSDILRSPPRREPPHIARLLGKRLQISAPDNPLNEDEECQHLDIFAISVTQGLWPLPAQFSTDEESWDQNLLRDTAHSKGLIADRLVWNPKEASDSVKRAGKDYYLWRIHHRVPGGSTHPHHCSSTEKNIQGSISRRSLRANPVFPPPKFVPATLRDTISAQWNGRQLYEGKASLLHLRHTFRTSGSSNMITQRGPHETIIASSALKGTPDAIPDPEARGATIDPRSENKMGTVMYKKTSPSLLNSSADPIAGHTLEISEPTWEVLKTHYRRAHVTTTEFETTQAPENPTNRPRRKRVIRRHKYNHYLSCTDIKFVPNSHHYNDGVSEFLTAAMDGTVRLWTPQMAIGSWFEEVDDGHQAKVIWDVSTYDTEGMGAVPSSIHFDPSPPSGTSPLFIATCSRSGVVHLQSTSEHLAQVAVSPTASPENAFDSYACWGRGASAGWVFAGTDPSQDQQTGCRVLRFDTRSGDIHSSGRWQTEPFPLEEDFCQFLTTDSTGQRLAIVANDKVSRDLMLRIYDLRAPLASRASLSLEYNLDAMQNKSCPSSRAPASPIHRRNSSSSGDRSSLSDDEDRHSSKGASVAAFSPDDVYIAIGRENNVAQVLDSRFVREEILVCRHEAQHSGENVGDGGAGGSDPTFGITALDWIDAAGGPNRSKNVLATGGDDGAVRVWDLRRAREDSGNNILSKRDVDKLVGIGAFHLGNVYEGESALIVGDCVGVVQEYVDFPTPDQYD